METHRLQLAACTQEHIPVLMKWIQSETQCREWGGPFFRYPFDTQSFAEDCSWQKLPSFVLQGVAGKLLAFGQFYRRLERCHLGRLIVAPEARGCGIGKSLIRLLAKQGCNALATDQCSLFVLKNNRPAQALYEKIGFQRRDYPEPFEGLELCHFMTASAKEILEMEI
ncbi:N-acetyltransferase [Microbulbifer sp. ALW1]|uniref:GNAT family N-acetyltransferase n=1 Tax=Microbulbifer sp. (strain ALW1) TaxID=1516059 RepID=UPI00135BF6E7|nr:GNAT family N-acetyltransferase [Microbulbifer sp. ALW1]